MIFLRELIMPDASLTAAEKTVVAFCEIVAFALGWGAVDRLLAGTSLLIVIPLFIACAAISYFGFAWPSLKPRISSRVTSTVERVGVSFRVRLAALLLFAFGGVCYLLITIHSIRSDVDAYAKPRTVSPEQAAKLQEYLSRYDPAAVQMRVVWNQEAMDFASQLYFALIKTKWEINPPSHTGPDFLHQSNIFTKPAPDEKDANGKPRFPTLAAYMNAHDDWQRIEIENRFIEHGDTMNYGICVNQESPGPINPDPQHPDPQQILVLALQYAGFGERLCSGNVYNRPKTVLYLTVEVRPPALVHDTLLSDLKRWAAKWLQ